MSNSGNTDSDYDAGFYRAIKDCCDTIDFRIEVCAQLNKSIIFKDEMKVIKNAIYARMPLGCDVTCKNDFGYAAGIKRVYDYLNNFEED